VELIQALSAQATRNDKFIAANGETKAIIENGFPLVLIGAAHTTTVRNMDCAQYFDSWSSL